MSKQLNNVKSVSISAGNMKMGAIPSVSLPPVLTCASGCPCAEKCYAVKICKLRPNVRSAYQRNLDILKCDPARYWSDIDKAVKMSRFFRFHVSGDIVSPEYFESMVETARNNPACEILAFTKQYGIVNAWLDSNGGNLPKNLHVVFSLWDPAWNANISNPYNLPMSAVIFKGAEHTAEYFDKICPGNCFECAARGVGCWTLESGETIAFYEH